MQKAFAANYSQEVEYGILKTTWQPKFPAGILIPIFIHPLLPGLPGYAQPRTSLHTREAGYSTCAYTVMATM